MVVKFNMFIEKYVVFIYVKYKLSHYYNTREVGFEKYMKFSAHTKTFQ